MVILKITLGLLLLIAAWGYLFQKKLIFKLNAWMREIVFSDQLALFSGRRVAILLFFLGGLSVFSGIEPIIQPSPPPPHIFSKILNEARQDLVAKSYPRVLRRVRQLIKADPNSVPAWELLVETYARMGDKEAARQAATVLLRLDPNHPLGRIVARDEWDKIHRDEQ